jgi:DNA-binding ferritin-like protein
MATLTARLAASMDLMHQAKPAHWYVKFEGGTV